MTSTLSSKFGRVVRTLARVAVATAVSAQVAVAQETPSSFIARIESAQVPDRQGFGSLSIPQPMPRLRVPGSGWSNGGASTPAATPNDTLTQASDSLFVADSGLTCTGTPQLGCGLALDQFSLVPSGTFQMGSSSPGSVDHLSAEPVHAVTISRAFYLQKTEVTQAQWRAVMGDDPSYFAKCGDTCPVEGVSWKDIQKFIQRLNGNGVSYRLPTEAEWEYAARAGTTGPTYGALDAIAWYLDNSSEKNATRFRNRRIHAVAGKEANTWGLYDMIGNVEEWVNDWYGAYSSAAVTDPTGPASGSFRVLRGGSSELGSRRATVASRRYTDALARNADLGFRLVRIPNENH